MRLRVTAGRRPAALPGSQDLHVVYDAPDLLIEASGDVKPLAGQAFLAGEVYGIFSENGTLTTASGSGALAEVVRENNAEATRAKLEGRFLIAAVRSDGGCDVFSDRFGKRDLYIQRTGGATLAASDLSLLPVAAGERKYDQAALAHVFAVYGWRPPKRHTLYQDVSRLGVGETLHLRAGSGSLGATMFQPERTAAYEERDLHRYADALLDAIRSQASADGNVVYLSSGWDSTAILGGLVHLFGPGKVRAVIGRMRYSERSGVVNRFEMDRAAAVAAFYGVPLEIVEFDYRQHGPDLLERLGPHLQAQQVVSLTALSHGYLAEHIAKTARGGEVAFAGEISDGAHNLGFSQFATIFHPTLEFREYSDKMASYLFGPTFLQSFITGRFKDDIIYRWMSARFDPASFDEWTDGTPVDHTRRLLASFFLRSNRIPLWSLKTSRVLTAAGREMYTAAIEAEYLGRAAREVTPETLYAWYLWLYNSFHWQGSTVASMAVTAEANNVRLALPFWDSRIQSFLSTMPETWGRGLDLNPTKYPLKWTLKNRIRYPLHLQVGPHSYLYDVEHTFNHAVEVLYHSAFTPFFKSRLERRAYRSLLSPEFMDVAYLDGIVSKYLAGTEMIGAELGDLVSVIWLSACGWYGCD